MTDHPNQPAVPGSPAPDPTLDLSAPSALIDDLAALDGGPVFVPPDVDDRVLGEAREHFGRLAGARRWRRLLAPGGAGAALAAAIALMVWLGGRPAPHGSPAPAPPAVAVAEDIDGNGRVDILDAMKLARRLDAQTGGDADTDTSIQRFDFNGDGVVDQRDVDAVAARAVAVSKEMRS